MKKSYLLGLASLVLVFPLSAHAQSLELSSTPATASAISFSATQSAVVDDEQQLSQPWYDAYLTLATDAQRSLLVEPTRTGDDYSLALHPGDKTQLQFTLTNTTDQNYYVRTILRDFVVGADGETPLLADNDNLAGQYALADWLLASREWTYLEAHHQTKINLTLQIPADAQPGGYYAMLLAQAWENSPLEQALDPDYNPPPAQVGALIYVVVDIDQLTAKLAVKDFKFDPFREQGPVNFSFSVANQSNYHLRPTGTITITDWLGKEVAILEIPAQNIFPGASRAYNGSFDQNWGIGLYKAELKLDDFTPVEASFWLLPIRLMVLAGLIILIIIVAVVTNKKRKNKKKKDDC